MSSGKKILVTGACGFIGKAISVSPVSTDKMILLANKSVCNNDQENVIFVNADIEDGNALKKICEKHKPDVVIHCAGIAHQKIGTIDQEEYFRINSFASEKLAMAAAAANPDVYFIFLSSISVYGEKKAEEPVSEEDQCTPSSDYAQSKLDAESRLVALYRSGKLKKLDILRLAPVYDQGWTLNLDKRVFVPKKIAYVKFGCGTQKMSAVSRQNVVDFVHHRIKQQTGSDSLFCRVLNVCDEKPYAFSEIINVFKDSRHHGDKLVIRVPLVVVWLVTRMVGWIFKAKKQWIYSCYDKLSCDLVFDNRKMLETGFKPKHKLE